MTPLDTLYRNVGSAIHQAQLAEYNIVSIYILLSRIDLAASRKHLEEEFWAKKTLGQLLKPIIESELIPHDARLFLQTFVNARNHLAHSLFFSDSEIHTPSGLQDLLNEVSAMQDVFDRAFKFFEHVLSELALPAGIDTDAIKEEAKKLVSQIDSDLPC